MWARLEVAQILPSICFSGLHHPTNKTISDAGCHQPCHNQPVGTARLNKSRSAATCRNRILCRCKYSGYDLMVLECTALVCSVYTKTGLQLRMNLWSELQLRCQCNNWSPQRPELTLLWCGSRMQHMGINRGASENKYHLEVHLDRQGMVFVIPSSHSKECM